MDHAPFDGGESRDIQERMIKIIAEMPIVHELSEVYEVGSGQMHKNGFKDMPNNMRDMVRSKGNKYSSQGE